MTTGVADPDWPADGKALCTKGDFGGAEKRVASDAAGGAIVVWVGHSIDVLRAFADEVLDVPPGTMARPIPVGTPHPNPTRSGATIAFELADPREVVVSIYEVSGRLVRTLATGQEFTAGSHRLFWDGASDVGTKVGSGVYFVRVTVGGVPVARTITVLR